MASCWPPGSWDEGGDVQTDPSYVYLVQLNDHTLSAHKNPTNAFAKLWADATHHSEFPKVANLKIMKEANEKNAVYDVVKHGTWTFTFASYNYRIQECEVEN
jgi:hypothetical protein